MPITYEDLVGGGGQLVTDNLLLQAIVRALIKTFNEGIPVTASFTPPSNQDVTVTNTVDVTPDISRDSGAVDANTTRVVLEDQSRNSLEQLRSDLTGLLALLKSGIQFNPSALGAGGELSVGEKTTLGAYLMHVDNQPLLLSRAGTNPVANQVWSGGEVTMAVTGTSGNFEICQSYQRHPYFPGKPQLVEITFRKFDRETGVEKEVGYFQSLSFVSPYNTALDGITLFVNDTTEHLRVYRNNVMICDVPRAGWDEKLDGTTAGAPILELGKFSIFVIDFLYLGGSSVRFGFRINGKLWWVHQYNHSNNIGSTLLLSPSHPVRWAIRSTGGAGSIVQICAAVSTVGSDIHGLRFSPSPLATFINANAAGTNYLIRAIRINPTTGKNVTVQHINFDVISSTADDCYVTVILNPTIANPNVWNSITNSRVQYMNGDFVGNPAVTTVTGGTLLYSLSLDQSNRRVSIDIDSLIKLGIAIDGTSDVIALCINPTINGTNADANGNFSFIEY